MKTYILFLVVFSGLVLSVTAQEMYVADVPKTSLTWFGEKVTGDHTGKISLKSGSLVLKDNKIVNGQFVIDMTSITCTDQTAEQYNTMLVNHLKSDDFFGVQAFPEAKIVIKESAVFDKGTAIVKGDLTIKGKTLPFEFKATQVKVDGVLTYYAVIIIDRSKYDIKYGSGAFFDNLGDKLIYDEFKLKITLVLTKK